MNPSETGFAKHFRFGNCLRGKIMNIAIYITTQGKHLLKSKLFFAPKKRTSFEQLVNLMVDADMAKVAVERAGEQVKTNLAEYLEKGIVK